MVNALAGKEAHYGSKIRKEFDRIERGLFMERSRWNRTPTPGPEAQCSTIELTPLNH